MKILFRVLALLPLPVLQAAGMDAPIRKRPAQHPRGHARDKKLRQEARA